jgi:hypothetical protein
LRRSTDQIFTAELFSVRSSADGIFMALLVAEIMLNSFIQTELLLGLNISFVCCVDSQRGGFMVLCGLVLILRGMRGYEQLFQRGGTSDTEEPNENQQIKPRGKSQREEACYYFSFSGSR